jgi:hypothetical protein
MAGLTLGSRRDALLLDLELTMLGFGQVFAAFKVRYTLFCCTYLKVILNSLPVVQPGLCYHSSFLFCGDL